MNPDLRYERPCRWLLFVGAGINWVAAMLIISDRVEAAPLQQLAQAGTSERATLGRRHDPTAARAWSISQAAVIRPMWLNACGKLPSSSPLATSISSASRPRSLA